MLAAAVAIAVPASAATYTSGAVNYPLGVDVSHYQGAIDWTQVVAASTRFVIGKATEGKTLIDPTYSINRTGAESFGMQFGAYHFARPGGSGDAAITANAIAQADFFLDVAEPQPGELPPSLDLEAKGGLAPAGLQTWTAAWLAEVTARTGVNASVYTSPNFWKAALADTASVAGAGSKLWIAHWTKDAAPLVPASNWGGASWTFWQWTNCAKVPGFAHCVDGDRFNGPDPVAVVMPAYPTGAPAPGSPPLVVGVAQTGKTLAGVPGTWAGGKPVTFVYQWQRCDAAGQGCIPIAGAASETYVPVTDDVGHALVASVTAQALGGAATASSPPTVAVAVSGTPVTRPAAVVPPQATGTTQAGQTLTASVGTWSGSPKTFAYQWQRCSQSGTACVAIAGATASTYTVAPGDIGATLSLVVTATGGGGSASAATPATAAVAAAPVPAAVPGSAVAQPALAGAVSSPDGTATLTWQPGAVPIGSTVSLAPSRRRPRGHCRAGDGAAAVARRRRLRRSAGGGGRRLLDRREDVAAGAAARLPVLPAGQVAGTTVDPAGLLHVVLLRARRPAPVPAGQLRRPDARRPGAAYTPARRRDQGAPAARRLGADHGARVRAIAGTPRGERDRQDEHEALDALEARRRTALVSYLRAAPDSGHVRARPGGRARPVRSHRCARHTHPRAVASRRRVTPWTSSCATHVFSTAASSILRPKAAAGCASARRSSWTRHRSSTRRSGSSRRRSSTVIYTSTRR